MMEGENLEIIRLYLLNKGIRPENLTDFLELLSDFSVGSTAQVRNFW